MSQLSLNEKGYQKILSFMDDIKVEDHNFREEILFAFEKLFGIHKMNFWLCDKQNNLYDPVTINIDKNITKDYVDNYLEVDPILPHKLKHIFPKRRVIGLLDLPKIEYEKNEYVNGFMKKHGIHNNTAMFLVKDSRVIGVLDFSSRNKNRINENEVMCLEIISRYLAQRFHEHLLLKDTGSFFFENFLTPREREKLYAMYRRDSQINKSPTCYLLA